MADPDTLLLRDLLRNLRDDCGHHDAPETREEAEAGLAALDRLEARLNDPARRGRRRRAGTTRWEWWRACRLAGWR